MPYDIFKEVKQIHKPSLGTRLSHRIRQWCLTWMQWTDASAWPYVLDDELSQDVTAQKIAGPFNNPPQPHWQCSGVGVIPKKAVGGWIMHLSAPVESSINDGINKEDITLRYSTVDDAVRMINKLGRNTPLAKVDTKRAFRMVSVRLEGSAVGNILEAERLLSAIWYSLSLIKMQRPYATTTKWQIPSIMILMIFYGRQTLITRL